MGGGGDEVAPTASSDGMMTTCQRIDPPGTPRAALLAAAAAATATLAERPNMTISSSKNPGSRIEPASDIGTGNALLNGITEAPETLHPLSSASASVPLTSSADVLSTGDSVPCAINATAVAASSTQAAALPPEPEPLRRGKWTLEEEAYVERIINDFNSGLLDAPAGTTLRSYLSEKLNCDPMRITKKFTGDACIGKRVFHPLLDEGSGAGVSSSTVSFAPTGTSQTASSDAVSHEIKATVVGSINSSSRIRSSVEETIRKAQDELMALELAFRNKLLDQKKEAARKLKKGSMGLLVGDFGLGVSSGEGTRSEWSSAGSSAENCSSDDGVTRLGDGGRANEDAGRAGQKRKRIKSGARGPRRQAKREGMKWLAEAKAALQSSQLTLGEVDRLLSSCEAMAQKHRIHVQGLAPLCSGSALQSEFVEETETEAARGSAVAPDNGATSSSVFGALTASALSAWRASTPSAWSPVAALHTPGGERNSCSGSMYDSGGIPRGQEGAKYPVHEEDEDEDEDEDDDDDDDDDDCGIGGYREREEHDYGDKDVCSGEEEGVYEEQVKAPGKFGGLYGYGDRRSLSRGASGGGEAKWEQHAGQRLCKTRSGGLGAGKKQQGIDGGSRGGSMGSLRCSRVRSSSSADFGLDSACTDAGADAGLLMGFVNTLHKEASFSGKRSLASEELAGPLAEDG